MLLTVLVAVVGAYVLFALYSVARGYQKYLMLKKAGVEFPLGFSYLSELLKIGEFAKNYPVRFNAKEIYCHILKAERLPPVLGGVFFGQPFLIFNSVDSLQDLFVNQNKYMTKHEECALLSTKFMSRSLILDQTDDKDYIEKRKELNGAFYK